MKKNEFAKIFKRDPRFYYESLVEDYHNSKDPEFFKPTGTQIFTGMQGEGKTISMVHTLVKLHKKYPRAIIVTNLKLSPIIFNDVIEFQSIDELGDKLTGINNGKFGVIYAIDEIHTYFNALDSKSIPPYIFTEISQQRKQRKLILGTSQLYLRLAKPFREQCNTLVICRCYFGLLCTQTLYDGATLTEDFGELYGQCIGHGMFWQSLELRACYDTFQKIVSGREQYLEYVAGTGSAGAGVKSPARIGSRRKVS